MNEPTLSQLLTDESMPVDVEWLRQLMADHPTCVLPAALLLRRNAFLLTDEEADRLTATVMLAAPDPQAMADLADLSHDDWQHFYPAVAKSAPDTVDTIDTFLERYGNVSAAEGAMLERMIFNPVPPDYFQDSPDPGIDSNWSDLMQPPEPVQPKPQPKQAAAPEQPETAAAAPEQGILRLSLAKIFIKQRRYERAFEIINNLSLNNPEKSAYFADQLRFLQKLINNQRFLDSQS